MFTTSAVRSIYPHSKSRTTREGPLIEGKHLNSLKGVSATKQVRTVVSRLAERFAFDLTEECSSLRLKHNDEEQTLLIEVLGGNRVRITNGDRFSGRTLRVTYYVGDKRGWIPLSLDESCGWFDDSERVTTVADISPNGFVLSACRALPGLVRLVDAWALQIRSEKWTRRACRVDDHLLFAVAA